MRLQGRDDRHSDSMGAYHVHKCEWCGCDIPCYNGPKCDMGVTQGYCSQDCYDRKRRKGGGEGTACDY
jgi:hypothetical protein